MEDDVIDDAKRLANYVETKVSGMVQLLMAESNTTAASALLNLADTFIHELRVFSGVEVRRPDD